MSGEKVINYSRNLAISMIEINIGAAYLTIQKTPLLICLLILPRFVSSLCKKDFGTIHPRNRQVMIAAVGSIRLVANVSRKSKKFIENILMWDRGPWEREHKELRATKGSITIQHAFFLPILNLSETNAIETSDSEIVEVTAATKSNKKKRDDQKRVKGMEANTSGSVTNTKVAPSKDSPLSPKDMTAGKIIIPINIATPRSSAETVAAVLTRLVFLG